MARKVIDIIYNFVRKRLAQQSTKGGITSLPQSKQIEQGMQEIFTHLRGGGLNPVSADQIIKNEKDLVRTVNKIIQSNNQRMERENLVNRTTQEVLDKMSKNKPLNPLDQEKLEAAGFRVDASKFKGFEPKVIEGGKDLTMKTPGGEIPYIESPTQTIIQGGKKVPVKIPKGIKDDVLEAYDNISYNIVRGDTKYNADVLAPELARRRGFIDEVQEATDMDQRKYSDLYSEAYSFLTKLNFLNRSPKKPKKAKGGIVSAVKKLQKKFGKDIIQKGKAPKKSKKKELQDMFREFNRKNKAGGGLAYMLGEPRQAKSGGGAIFKFLKALSKKSPFQAYKDYLASVKKRSIEGDFKSLAPELGAVSAGGILINRKMKKILEEGNEQQKERLLEEFIEGLDKDPFYEKYPDLKDKAIEKYTERMFGEKRADGGRIGFADGGMSRRTFLKIMAALAAFPVVGKLAKTTKVAKGVKPIITPTADMPAHFPKLVEKIIKEGQVVKKEYIKKTGDVTTYKHPDRADIELTIEGDGQRIQLDFDTDQGMKGGYEFRKGVPDETVSKPPDEFTEGEVKYHMSPEGDYTKDFEFGVDTGTENLDEFVGIRKQKTSKSKVNLPQSTDDFVQPGRIKDDLADGGLAGLLGE